MECCADMFGITATKWKWYDIFWNAAISLSEDALEKDEAVRFPICNADKLRQLFQSEGLTDIETSIIDVPTVFKDFDDFWKPFLQVKPPLQDIVCHYQKEPDKNLNKKYLNRFLLKMMAAFILLQEQSL